jgi:cyclomaltodextrinase
MNRRLTAFLLAAALCLAQRPNARASADWIRSSVIYEINVATFSPTRNFRGVEGRLDDLKQLGVNILWLMPIHPNGQKERKGTFGSSYAVRDYYAINPDYGTAEDLRHLVAAAHRRGLKVILDTVPNHTAWDNALIQDKSFYKRNAQGEVISPTPDWNDVAGLDYSNPKVREYMTGVYKYWLRDFDLDGFRCDVAFMPPVEFWNDLRPQLDAIKGGIVMIAEANVPELLVKAFDLDYSWPFHSAITNVFENGASADTLRTNWQEQRERYPEGAMEMRFSDNHDEKRAIVRFGEKGTLAASALVFTMDGVPMIYNGMESGDTTESGGPALFEHLPVFWKIVERRPEFPAFYREMIALRRSHPALQEGETVWLDNSDSKRILTYLRKSNAEEFLVAINTSNRPFTGDVDAENGEWIDVTPGVANRPPLTLPGLVLDAWGFRIYQKR